MVSGLFGLCHAHMLQPGSVHRLKHCHGVAWIDVLVFFLARRRQILERWKHLSGRQWILAAHREREAVDQLEGPDVFPNFCVAQIAVVAIDQCKKSARC